MLLMAGLSVQKKFNVNLLPEGVGSTTSVELPRNGAIADYSLPKTIYSRGVRKHSNLILKNIRLYRNYYI